MFPLAFRYRDWVIDALNADVPYNEFVKQQLAGDLMPASTDEQRNAQTIATGFLCVGTKDLREKLESRYRMNMAEEQIDVVGRALLGLTIACAKCHDHKFDPIPTRDYYALAGIFTSSEPMLGARRNRERNTFAAGLLPLAGGGSDFTDADQAVLLKQRVDIIYAQLKHRDARWSVLNEMKIPVKKATPAHDAIVDARPEVQAAAAQVADMEAEYEALRQRYDAAMSKSMIGLRDVKPQDVAVHIRGEDTQLGEIVPRGFLQVLTDEKTRPVERDQSGRVELAEWIASEHNPLTARVMVNRIWFHLFGTGLVETPDDFGKTGEPPSNLALLDYLARRFIEHDWSAKKLIAEIMSSHVYQLSSEHEAHACEVDPANRLYWRMNRRRLDSDAILDSILAISGELVVERPTPQWPTLEKDDRIKSMDLEPRFARTRNHRTIYQPVLRDYIPDDWFVFDFPDPSLVTGKRSLTTVPTQALYWMNSRFVVEQSQRTSKRLLAKSRGADALIQEAYSRILSRPPNRVELDEARLFLKTFQSESSEPAAAAALCQTLFASAEFRYLD